MTLGEGERWAERRQRAQLTQTQEDAFRLRFAERAQELVAEARAADRLQVANVSLEPAQCLWLEAKAQAGLVAGAAKDAGGVVAEACFVEGAQKPGLQVGGTVEGVDEVAGAVAGEGEGEGVRGEIAAGGGAAGGPAGGRMAPPSQVS